MDASSDELLSKTIMENMNSTSHAMLREQTNLDRQIVPIRGGHVKTHARPINNIMLFYDQQRIFSLLMQADGFLKLL